MSDRSTQLVLRHHTADEALRLREEIVPIYAASHAHLIHLPWYSPDDFWQRLTDMYAKTRDFDLVTGTADGHIVGYAFGSPRDGDDLWPEIHHAFPRLEPSGPVYIFREFAVHPDQQQRGYGTLIHHELLRSRPETAAHLLVRTDNTPALTAYRHWGWRAVGTKQPFPDSPTFAAMAISLPEFKRQHLKPSEGGS